MSTEQKHTRWPYNFASEETLQLLLMNRKKSDALVKFRKEGGPTGDIRGTVGELQTNNQQTAKPKRKRKPKNVAVAC